MLHPAGGGLPGPVAVPAAAPLGILRELGAHLPV